MSTDTPFYAPDHQAAATPPRPAAHLWTVTRGADVCRAELRRGWGDRMELQVLLNGELRSGELHVDRAAAEADGKTKREALLQRGWTTPPQSDHLLPER